MSAGRAWPPLLLAGACIPLLLWKLGSYSFVNGDEALYHGVAESMVASGDWLTLRFRGEPRLYDTFMNAPLQYWARAVLIAVFGSSPWTARILSAIFGVGAVLATWRLGLELDREHGPWAPLAAAGALLTSLQFVYLHSARTGELDTAVAFFLVVSAWLFLRTLERGGGFWGHHACVAVLLTLKLPLVLVPLAAELAVFALRRDARPHLGRWLRTGLVVAPIALVWHAGQALALGDAFVEVVRTMGGQASGDVGVAVGGAARSQVAYYAAVAAFGAWPWALAWPWAVVSVLRRGVAEGHVGRWLVPGCYAAAVVAFFLLVSKRAPWYVLPAYPFLQLFVGSWLVGLARRVPDAVELVGAALVLAAVAWVAVPMVGYDPFALPAVHVPMPVRVRGPGGGLSLAGWLATGVAVALALGALRARLAGGARARFGAGLAAGIAAGLVLPAAVRVAAPLAFLDHQSPLAQLARALEDRRAAGVPLREPVDVPSGSPLLVRYYFGDAWYTVPVRRADGTLGLRIVPRDGERATGR